MAPLGSAHHWKGITLAIVLVCGAAPGAMANPDVWVKVKYTLNFDETSLTGLKIDWLFDPFFSNRAIQQFDKDRDRQLSDAEVAALRAEFFDHFEDKKYFLHVLVPDTPAPMRNESFLAKADAEQFALSLVLVPETPIAYRNGPVIIGTYDDAIFFDFTLADEDFLRVEGPFDPACRFQIRPGDGPLTGQKQAIALLCEE